MAPDRVIIVGAGVAGLVAAIDLARRGARVHVVERAPEPGGKMRGVGVADRVVDGGPTVLTMRWVFDELFADASLSFEERLRPRRAEILARHAWPDGARLDLFSDLDRSRDAIAEVFGPREAEGYVRFSREAEAIFGTLDASFLRATRPSPIDLTRTLGLSRMGELFRIRPFATLWRALGDYFADPRLRQLFGRYATYVGSSPFRAPATLMLIAHVERAGVWRVDGGMAGLSHALAEAAVSSGAEIRCDADVARVVVEGDRLAGIELATGERLEADRVLLAGDAAALASGALGEDARRRGRVRPATERSLSAVTWNLVAETDGFPLVHHNVFFSDDYAAEFEAIFRAGRLPEPATVYVCAQDREAHAATDVDGAERLLCLANAPATGDRAEWTGEEIERWEQGIFEGLEQQGLTIARRSQATVRRTPADWHRLFPATGGALYGPSTHGWRASFARPGPRTRLPGLYLAGGSTHPGAGVPMAALSGRQAAEAILRDCASTGSRRATAIAGGTSMR